MCIFVYSNPKPESSLFKIVQFSKRRHHTTVDKTSPLPFPLSFVNVLTPLIPCLLSSYSVLLLNCRVLVSATSTLNHFQYSQIQSMYFKAKTCYWVKVLVTFSFSCNVSVSSINLLSAVKYLFSWVSKVCDVSFVQNHQWKQDLQHQELRVATIAALSQQIKGKP